MKKFLKSKKALSPVVAAIILIAVTVAVSIAVAAWMGSMTMNFMETSELTITQMTFDTANDNITLNITNSGTSDVVVSQVRVNGNPATSFTMTPSTGFTAGSTDGTIELNYSTGVNPGSKYAVSLFANDGTMIGSYTDTA